MIETSSFCVCVCVFLQMRLFLYLSSAVLLLVASTLAFAQVPTETESSLPSSVACPDPTPTSWEARRPERVGAGEHPVWARTSIYMLKDATPLTRCVDKFIELGEDKSDSNYSIPLPYPRQFRGRNLHSHGVSYEDGSAMAVGNLTELWRYETINVGIHTASKSSPVVDAQHIYVGSDFGARLYALHRANGSVHWIFHGRPCHFGIHSTPAVDDTHVYIGDYAGWLYAVNKHTGQLVWEVELGQSIGASPQIVGDRIYIGVEMNRPKANGYLAVVDRRNGRVLFYGPYLNEHTHCTPTVVLPISEEERQEDREAWAEAMKELGDEAVKPSAIGLLTPGAFASPDRTRVYMGSNAGEMHCLDGDTGVTLWSFRTYGARAKPFVLQKQKARLEAKRAPRIKQQARRKAYSACLKEPDMTTLKCDKRIKKEYGEEEDIEEDEDDLDDDEISGVNDQDMIEGDLREICQAHKAQGDRTLCSLAWRSMLPGRNGQVKAPAVYVEDKILFGSWDHGLYCLNATTGEQLWVYFAYNIIMSSITVHEPSRTVFFGSHDHLIYSLRLDDGRMLWSLRTRERVYGAPLLVPRLPKAGEDPVAVADIFRLENYVLYFGSFDGVLYMINPVTGHKYPSTKQLGRGAITNEIVAANHTLYVSTNGGTLFALRTLQA